MTTTDNHRPGTVRHLYCSCCGGSAGRWAQHWNMDTGHGVCARCVKWLLGRGETAEEIRFRYGVEGVNYAPAETGGAA